MTGKKAGIVNRNYWTTIRVRRQTYERLQALARDQGIPMTKLLDQIVRDYATMLMFEQANVACAADTPGAIMSRYGASP